MKLHELAGLHPLIGNAYASKLKNSHRQQKTPLTIISGL